MFWGQQHFVVFVVLFVFLLLFFIGFWGPWAHGAVVTAGKTEAFGTAMLFSFTINIRFRKSAEQRLCESNQRLLSAHTSEANSLNAKRG